MTDDKTPKNERVTELYPIPDMNHLIESMRESMALLIRQRDAAMLARTAAAAERDVLRAGLARAVNALNNEGLFNAARELQALVLY